MNLIYAKKFRFPDNSANMIQGGNMVAAFSHHNINTNAFFSFNDTINDRNSFLKDCYGINFSRQSNQIHFTSQKLRGLNYNLWLIKNIINKKNVVLKTLLIITIYNSIGRNGYRIASDSRPVSTISFKSTDISMQFITDTRI